MSAQTPSARQPPPKKKRLTPVQIGAGVGAAITVLCLFAVRDLSPQWVGGNLSNVLIGVWGALGALLGMAIVSLVNFIRRQKRDAGVQDAVDEEKTEAAVRPVLAHEAQTEGNGSPMLRVAAGVLALLLATTLPLMAAQGKLPWDSVVLIGALALLFGWYGVRGRKGLPKFLTKK